MLFHQDNIATHTSAAAMTFHNCSFGLFDHPPYSPELLPFDFHMFLNPKKRLAGAHFTTDDALMAAAGILKHARQGHLPGRHCNTAATIGEMCGVEE